MCDHKEKKCGGKGKCCKAFKEGVKKMDAPEKPKKCCKAEKSACKPPENKQ